MIRSLSTRDIKQAFVVIVANFVGSQIQVHNP